MTSPGLNRASSTDHTSTIGVRWLGLTVAKYGTVVALMLRTLAAISVFASFSAIAIAAQGESDSTLTPRQLFYTERTRPAKPQKPKESQPKAASSPAKSEQPPAPVTEQ